MLVLIEMLVAIPAEFAVRIAEIVAELEVYFAFQ
jgi:hypothetical protein